MRIGCRMALLLVVTWVVVPALVCASPSATSFQTESPDSIPKTGSTDQVAALSTPVQSPGTEESVETLPDPLEPINRIFFQFNDRLYFWVLKPVATGYKAVFPEPARVGVKNFFSNLTTPIRFVNCLLQGNFKGAGNETIRLLLNSTLGLAGFLDPAKKELQIDKQDEDFGQTLGVWGMGPLFYIEWPILGASSGRDSIGFVGDLLADPRTYLLSSFPVDLDLLDSLPVSLGIRAYEEINDTSLTLGDYEALIKASVDPYIAKRDAYYQYRQNKIRERGKTPEPAISSGQPQRLLSVQVAQLDLPKDDRSFFTY
jgi:phospholipid-binding lipoprotein MlaA